MKNKLLKIREVLDNLAINSAFIQSTGFVREKIIESLENKGKILVCGNGGSATQASHMVGELVGRFGFDRPPLPAISLFDLATSTAVGNDYGYDDIFSRFVESLGQKGDILFSLSTSGNSGNCLKAMEAAKQKEMINIALLGKDGGKMKDLAEVAIIVPGDSPPLIQEVHLMVIHWLCEEVEKHFFKPKND
jgi:D-sedoheptulose 7-phosphate isomerase